MRERQNKYLSVLSAFGITPARAGKTWCPGLRIEHLWDHPRSCGKDRIHITPMAYMLGSPPLVRERPTTASMSTKPTGITPARAGKTLVKASRSYSDEDHPRSCGKDETVNGYLLGFGGSPPLVRERPLSARILCRHSRITPARAGKTVPLLGLESRLEDHPRSCGKDR